MVVPVSRVVIPVSPVLIAVLALAACSKSGGTDAAAPAEQAPPHTPASYTPDQHLASNAEYLASEPYHSADRENGAKLAQMCRSCHTFGAGEPALLGPALHGVFGREAGSVEGFDYSDALRTAGIVWTPAALDAWLAQPSRFLPGNRMTFAGVTEVSDRADLIAYLLVVTAAGN